MEQDLGKQAQKERQFQRYIGPIQPTGPDNLYVTQSARALCMNCGDQYCPDVCKPEISYSGGILTARVPEGQEMHGNFGSVIPGRCTLRTGDFPGWETAFMLRPVPESGSSLNTERGGH